MLKKIYIFLFVILATCISLPHISARIIAHKYEKLIQNLNTRFGSVFLFKGSFKYGYLNSKAVTQVFFKGALFDKPDALIVTLNHDIFAGPVIFEQPHEQKVISNNLASTFKKFIPNGHLNAAQINTTLTNTTNEIPTIKQITTIFNFAGQGNSNLTMSINSWQNNLNIKHDQYLTKITLKHNIEYKEADLSVYNKMLHQAGNAQIKVATKNIKNNLEFNEGQYNIIDFIENCTIQVHADNDPMNIAIELLSINNLQQTFTNNPEDRNTAFSLKIDNIKIAPQIHKKTFLFSDLKYTLSLENWMEMDKSEFAKNQAYNFLMLLRAMTKNPAVTYTDLKNSIPTSSMPTISFTFSIQMPEGKIAATFYIQLLKNELPANMSEISLQEFPKFIKLNYNIQVSKPIVDECIHLMCATNETVDIHNPVNTLTQQPIQSSTQQATPTSTKIKPPIDTNQQTAVTLNTNQNTDQQKPVALSPEEKCIAEKQMSIQQLLNSELIIINDNTYIQDIKLEGGTLNLNGKNRDLNSFYPTR